MSRQRYTLDDLQEYASRSGGKCLSKEYVNLSTPLKWRCEKGHTWDADFQIIRQGGWCPACNKPQKDKEEKLKILKNIAKERGGKCLSKEYINNSTKVQFKCGEGHIWLMRPHDFKAGQWCPKCGIKRRIEKRKTPIEVYKKYAHSKGGKFLSTNYSSGHQKLLWQCGKGHQWSAAGVMVVNAKTWCPHCRGMYKDISDMQALAKKRGGKCLSKKYINSKTKLKWQCDKGHVWQSAPNNITNNCWCPTCGYVTNGAKQNDSIEKYKKIAIKKGGRLLTDIYINNNTLMLWQCKNGHKWKARGANVFHMNSWCPFCFDIKMGRKVRQTLIK
ncbi:MAG: hypothetical protein IM600_09745 [Bacteroidetes bacterium]|jgi:hypothetical protein|nr:hypothetical protein [Bacteroidota bacterium]MCA6443696.1 hypothetical protein [Bacteroidota bacterium]